MSRIDLRPWERARDRAQLEIERWVSRVAKHPLVRKRGRELAVGGCILFVGMIILVSTLGHRAEVAETPDQGHREGALFFPAPKHWETLTIGPVTQHVFRRAHTTEGKIAVDEDRATLVYSPYAGRVIKLLAKPGDIVAAGQPLFVVESPDMVQAQNDFINAAAALNKARAALDLAKIVEQQNVKLFETRAVPQRDLQQSQAATLAAQNDVRGAEISLEAVRNRLRILGKTDEEITKFNETGAISPQTTIYSPIAGTVVQRKVGPGQYINTTSNSAAANDATYVIGDLSTVWLVGYVRESEAPRVKVGQALDFKVLAFSDRVFHANINYVATSLDPSTRRLLVRATIDNSDVLLRPEMFASVTIFTGEGDTSLAVPRDAVLYDGSEARIWVVREDGKAVEPRKIKTGLIDGSMVQVIDGLQLGERVVAKGSLFIDRLAAGS
jgi:cobalt-zinc-cadmium efflux system membrane fusion protein